MLKLQILITCGQGGNRWVNFVKMLWNCPFRLSITAYNCCLPPGDALAFADFAAKTKSLVVFLAGLAGLSIPHLKHVAIDEIFLKLLLNKSPFQMIIQYNLFFKYEEF